MKTSNIIKNSAAAFVAFNLAYIGYALIKNHKDYKNKTGEYKQEEPKTEDIVLFNASEYDTETMKKPKPNNVATSTDISKPQRKRKIKKTVWIGIGLLSAAVIGGYCYGFKSGYGKCKVSADKLINDYSNDISNKENVITTLKDRIENYEVEREKITSNALDMLLPGYMETRWVTINKKGNAKNNYTPKVTKDLNADDILEKINDTWAKLHEPVVVVPEVEEQ